jgi:hypothetical protein
MLYFFAFYENLREFICFGLTNKGELYAQPV